MEARVMSLLLLMAVVASASAAASPGCCAPDQWQARMRLIHSYNKKDALTKITRTEILMAYDVVGKRKVTMMNQTSQSGTTRTMKMQNYQTGKGFLYNIDTDICKLNPTGLTFDKLCLHSESKMRSKKVWKLLGAVNVQSASAVYQSHSNFSSYYELAVVKDDDCFPIVKTIMYSAADSVQVWHKTTLNMTKGIPSNDVFSIPDTCKSIMTRSAPESEEDMEKSVQ